MTIIEFYDKTSIENIAGALLCKPERMILIGDKRKKLERCQTLYQRILSGRGIETEISYLLANRNNLQNIVEVLTHVVEAYENCIFDLTGGDELYLVAVGIIMNTFPDKVQCHRFNFNNETLIDCDSDGVVCAKGSFDISVEENVNIYGGEIVTAPENGIHTYSWKFTDDFVQDVEIVWDICRKNARLWNAQIGTLGAACNLFGTCDHLNISFDKELAVSAFKQQNIKFVCVEWILRELEKHGLIYSLVLQDTISFTFKNEQIKRCLTVAGQVLELVVAIKMRALRDKDGEPLYHDIRVGVVIDWDSADEDDAYRTINEIDVFAMKGSIPIFISCKNGNFDANELYKLNTVAEQFGGKYAKKILVATELDKLGDKVGYLRTRMEDMRIRCIEDADEMSDKEFEKILKSL